MHFQPYPGELSNMIAVLQLPLLLGHSSMNDLHICSSISIIQNECNSSKIILGSHINLPSSAYISELIILIFESSILYAFENPGHGSPVKKWLLKRFNKFKSFYCLYGP